MNLTALREKVKNALDYSPELQGFNDQVDSLLNDAYLNLWSLKRWTFSQKIKQFKFLPDILPERDTTTGTPINASVAKGSRRVTFSAVMDRLTPDDWEGAIFDLDNYEYTISKVVNSSEILLDRPFIGTSNIISTDWVIKKRYYPLPQDTLELLSLSHRDNPSNVGGGALPPYGKLKAILPRRDEELNLRTDYKAAYAEAFVWSPPQFILPGETLDLQFAPLEDNEGFLNNTYLEVCWAFIKDGQVGALSEPKTIKFTQPQPAPSYSLTVKFLSWDNQDIVADTWQSFDSQPTQWEGYKKIVFWNENFNRSTGQHLKVRPYPRVDAWDVAVTRQAADGTYAKVDQDFLRIGEMRYFYKPPLLAEGTDTPQMPYEFHQLIVYKVLEELYLKLGNGNMSDTYRRRIEKDAKTLEKRYCDHIDSNIVRGRFNIGGGDGFAPYDAQSLRRLS